MTKVYTTKSNAIRAAKSAGQDPATVYATEGGFTFPTPAPATESTSNPAGWETAGGPTDQESGPASNDDPAFAAKFAANMAEIDSQLATLAGGPATEPSNPAPASDPAPAKAKSARGKSKGKPAKGKAAKAAPAKPAKGKPGRKPKAPAEPKAPRDTKLARFVAMLKRPEGATLDDAMDAFGWQRHTARGAIAGTIKGRLGLVVETEKVDGKTVYRIPA